MCEFNSNMYGATYPDALCHDGYLMDMDRGYATENDMPCPKCNIREFAEYADFRSSGNAKQRRVALRRFQFKIIEKYEY